MKYCTYCGKEHVDEAVICVGCGRYFDKTVQNPTVPMKWYKFLIYFYMFTTAVGAFLSGIFYLTNACNTLELYTTETVFGPSPTYSDYLDAIVPVNIVYGMLFIGIGVFTIIARQHLANYKHTGPIFFYTVYIAGFVVSTVYSAVCYIIAQRFEWSYEFTQPEPFSLFNLILSLIETVLIVWLNYTYFKKRENLFNK